MPTTNTRYVDVDAATGGNGTTNALSGTNCAYKSLNIWEAARDDVGDLPTNDTIEECICESSDGAHTADTTAVTIDGWTTDATRYISIKTSAGARHAGVWSTSKYRLAKAGGIALTVGEDYVRIDGLQISNNTGSANNQHVLSVTTQTASNRFSLSNCIIVGHGHATYYQTGLQLNDADLVADIWNCIIYNITTGVADNYVFRVLTGTTVNLYSSTLVGGQYACRVATATLTCKNVYAGGASTEDFNRASGKLYKVNCASSDAGVSADDTSGSDETATNCVATAVAVNTTNFTNVTAGSEDFRLPAGSTLIGAGATLTDDPPGSTALGVDIAGTTRS